jgi:putative ABC transport system permease protein
MREFWRRELQSRLALLHLPLDQESAILEELVQDAEDRHAALVISGLPPEQATRQILHDLDETALVERLRLVPRSEAPGPVLGSAPGAMFADLWQDLRYGIRTLRKNPLFATLGILTLTLGIGASTAMFSVLNAVLIAPLPFAEPERLVEIAGTNRDAGWEQNSLSHANFWDLPDLARDFAHIGGATFANLNLTGREAPERLVAAQVSVGFLRALGVAPAAGRLFAPGEDREGHDTAVVILSHRFWQTHFGAAPRVIGASMTLDGTPRRIVGVLPPGTPWLDAGDVFVPLVRTANEDRGSMEVSAVGRLRPGVTAAQAQNDLSRVARILRERFPDVNKGFDIVSIPSSRWLANDTTRRALWILMGAVACLLLIAAVNLVNLLLAQATGRAREIALRAALGASRARVIRQLVVESLLLGGIGATLGLVLAYWLVGAVRTADTGIARLAFADVDGRVLVFTVIVGLLTSLATGIVTAFQTSHGALAPTLREGDRGSGGSPRQQRVRQVLVATEVALSLTLLVAAGLLLRSFGAVLRADRGFQTEHRILLQMNLPASYDAGRTWQLIEAFSQRAGAIPGVAAVAAVSSRPLDDGSTGLGIGAPADDRTDGAIPWATWRLITPNYFRTIGVPILRGRTFDDGEENGWAAWQKSKTPMPVIVSDRVARLIYPDADPIGREIILWKGQGDPRGRIVGVVGNMRERGLSNEPTLAVYMPARGAGWQSLQFVLNTTTSPGTLVPNVRALMVDIDRAVPISDVQTFDELVAQSLASRRFTLLLLTAFAGLAFVLALGGIHGVLSYNVARRTSEIGVRMALGANASSVLRLIVGQGMRPVFAGLAVGVAAAGLLSRLMAALLFGVTPTDPLTYAAVAAVIVAAAIVACLVPASRALRIDVINALRAE